MQLDTVWLYNTTGLIGLYSTRGNVLNAGEMNHTSLAAKLLTSSGLSSAEKEIYNFDYPKHQTRAGKTLQKRQTCMQGVL